MKITHTAIERPRLVLIGCMLIFAMAAWAFVLIPVQRTPAISKAVVLVSVPFPGAEPREVETQVTRKIEEKLQRLDNVDFIASTSMRGMSVTQVMFLDGVDPDNAKVEVNDIVNEARGELPGGREVIPGVNKIDFDNTPLLLVNLRAPKDFDERALKKIADEVQDEIDTISGVSGSQVFGGREREIHVDVDLDRAQQYDVTLADCRRSLNEFNSDLPAGEMNTGNFNPQILSDTKFKTVEDIEAAIIRETDGRVVRIKDVAKVHDTYRRLKNVAHLDGEECATIIVYKENDSNTLRTVGLIKERVEELKSKFPFLRFSTTRDTSEEINLMFRVLGSSFIFGAMLVLIILGWTMGLRISLLVLLAIPFSSAVALICLYWIDIPISNMVVFAFILAVGMVVDGAIIVAENIHRHIERGLEPIEAAKIGIDEVGMPVIMADLTTIAAYLPMLLVPGIMGDFMGVMPVVVCVALIGSVVVDHFVIPTLAAYWYSKQAHKEENPKSKGSSQSDEKLRVRPNLGKTVSLYKSVLEWGLAHRYAVVVCALLGFVWAIIMAGKLGTEFFPNGDRGQFEVRYEMPLGSSIEQTLAAEKLFVEPLEEMRTEDKENGQQIIMNYVSALGSSEGLASRLENDPAVGPEFGTIMVQLASPLDRPNDKHELIVMEDLRKRIEAREAQFPGIKYKIEQVEEGPPGGYDVGMRLTGDNHELLGRLGNRLINQLKKVPNTFDVGMDYRAESPAVLYQPNPYVLPFYQINETQINQALFTAINGDNSILMNIDDEDVALRVQASEPFRKTSANLDRLMIRGSNGKKATIAELCRVSHSQGVFAVNRYQNKPAVTVRCDINDQITAPAVFSYLRANVLKELGFVANQSSLLATADAAMSFSGTPGTPSEGMRLDFVGEQEQFREDFSSLQYTMVVAVVLIFAILVVQFNSFRQAVIVILTVPFSFIGVIAGNWIFGFPFSLATFIGLVSLAGVVVNDAIVVVDFINQARERGLSVRDAIIEAGINRLRPVFLTTVTTIGGLFPLFLNISGGAEFWQPLCGAIIFGLLLATFLTLLVVPVCYSLFYNRLFWSEESSDLITNPTISPKPLPHS